MINFGNYNILKTMITACDYAFLTHEVMQAVKSTQKLVIAPTTSHGLVMAYYNSDYKKILDSFTYNVPDSQYVRLSLYILYNVSLKDRVRGATLFRHICDTALKENMSLHLIGNNLQRLIRVLEHDYPNLILFYSDLQGKKLSGRTAEICTLDIKKNKPDIVLIGIGTPQQHILTKRLKIRKPIVCLGAAFDFLSGEKKESPEWMGSIGLEWLFRLMLEPRRLWKRYLVYGPLYVFLIFKQLISLAVNREVRGEII
ncbi:MAG: WecB/TagA/CpsF family glycosyltransferase [Candidatus Roizmanbacteria bacterium]|nr:WecB/TagA/CpsF family glycosyltransferase [Candidatus Roizmanbacteria bacterium]